MEYVNFYVSLPVFTYLELENSARKKRMTKNEFINNAINACLASNNNCLPRQKMPVFQTRIIKL